MGKKINLPVAGPTGEFPEGKLSESDDGELQLSLVRFWSPWATDKEGRIGDTTMAPQSTDRG